MNDYEKAAIRLLFLYDEDMSQSLDIARLLHRILRDLGYRVSARKKGVARSRTTYLAQKEEARALITQRLIVFNDLYGFTYGRVSIKDQKTMWGSCSAKKNLNFNYRLVQLPLDLVDYVIVHELCHLKEMNHSPRFWALVAQTIPDYAMRRKALRLQTLSL